MFATTNQYEHQGNGKFQHFIDKAKDLWCNFCIEEVNCFKVVVSGSSPYSSYFLGRLLATRTLGHTWDGVLVFTYLGV